jgi:hypothetical protein
MTRALIASLVRRALVALPIALLPTAAGAAGWEQAPRTFLALRETSPAALASFADRIAAAGGHAAVIDASGAAIVYAEDAVLARPEIARALTAVFPADVPERALAALDPGRRRTAAAWNFARTLDAADAGAGDDPPAGRAGPAFPDAGPRPVALAARPGPAPFDASTHVPYGADYYDTSEFLAGRIAVGVWLFDNIAPGSNWTASELSQTLGGVQAGLDNWVRKGGAPAALTFFIETHTEVSVSGTPIQSPMSMDETWVNEALGNRGWTGANGFEKCFAYNRSIRDAFAAQWCYSIFIADSNPNVNQGLFAGGGYAFSYYGGPWIYMSRYSTWAFNYMRYYAVVPMHETGHIFMDTDEYDGQLQYGGYLNVADADFQQCIMNQNDSSRVCVATRNQLGLARPGRQRHHRAARRSAGDEPHAGHAGSHDRRHTDLERARAGRDAPQPEPALELSAAPRHDDRPHRGGRMPRGRRRVERGGGERRSVRRIRRGLRMDRGAARARHARDRGSRAHHRRGLDHGVRERHRDGRSQRGRGAGGRALRARVLSTRAQSGRAGRHAQVRAARARLRVRGDRQRGWPPRAHAARGRAAGGAGWLAWDGRDDLGRRVPAGIYLCRLRSAAGNATRRLAVVR